MKVYASSLFLLHTFWWNIAMENLSCYAFAVLHKFAFDVCALVVCAPYEFRQWSYVV